MRRRIWPAVLAVSALFVVAYFIYTQYLVREIRAQYAVDSRIFSIVSRGLLESGENPDQALGALIDVRQSLDSLRVPFVWISESGEIQANPSADIPFDADSTKRRQQLAAYAAQLERSRPGNTVVVPGGGKIVFGDPPIIWWLRWIPAFQTAAALILMLVVFAVIRADMRAERERLWSAMARELAHQMGTPLSSLTGWLEVLALSPTEREAFAEDDYIARVMSADVERLERVSRRFELIGKPPALDFVDVADIVHELGDYFSPRLPKFGRGISLRTRVSGELPPVRANHVLLAWALENVIKNAVDALGGRGGRIVVLADTDEDAVLIRIGDNGPGIAPAVRDRIFEPGVSTKSAGWGVGLSLTRRIVQDLHGGRISVRSRASGGTVFDIVLPAAGA